MREMLLIKIGRTNKIYDANYILPSCLNLLRLVIMWASLLLADLSGSSTYLGKVLAQSQFLEGVLPLIVRSEFCNSALSILFN